MKKTYIVRLNDEERQICLDTIKKLKGAATKVRREQILLKADANGPNLNTHSIGAFYERFSPDRARSLARRLEIIPTPKHGSWLNSAENELSALTSQCVKGRRFDTIEKLRSEVEVDAWASGCNAKQKGVKWHFTLDKARTKLESLYPKFLE